MSDFSDFSLFWGTLLNPLLIFAFMIVMASLWTNRLISHQTFKIWFYVVILLYLFHADWAAVLSDEAWEVSSVPTPVRWAVIAAVWTFFAGELGSYRKESHRLKNHTD